MVNPRAILLYSHFCLFSNNMYIIYCHGRTFQILRQALYKLEWMSYADLDTWSKGI